MGRKKQKKMKFIRYLDSGIFHATIFFSLGMDYDEIVKYFKKVKAKYWLRGIENDRELINDATGLVMNRTAHLPDGEKKRCMYMVLKNQFEFTDEDMVMLSHEVFHLCQYILSEHSVDIIAENESSAYLHSHIMRQALKELRDVYK